MGKRTGCLRHRSSARYRSKAKALFPCANVLSSRALARGEPFRSLSERTSFAGVGEGISRAGVGLVAWGEAVSVLDSPGFFAVVGAGRVAAGEIAGVGRPGRLRAGRLRCSLCNRRSPPEGARRRPTAKSLAVFWTQLLRQTFAPCFPYRAYRCLTSTTLAGGLWLWVFRPSGGPGEDAAWHVCPVLLCQNWS